MGYLAKHHELSSELQRIVSETVLITLGVPVEHAPVSSCFDRELPIGIVHIVGGWNGAVSLAVTPRLGEQFSQKIFGTEAGHERSLVLEVVRELSNIVGGNLKSLLGERCALSSPKTGYLTPESVLPPESEVVEQLYFRCCQEQLAVTLSRSTTNLAFEM